MLAWKIAPALACGNTVVLKPAETTPLTALLFAEICQQADLPPGVVNIVTGAGDTGRALVAHPDVDKVAFTGSTDVGRAIAKSVAGTRKKVTLELGGKAANIVFDDAPIDQAVEGIVNGIFFNQGHVCCAGSRLLVQESVADEVVDRLKRRMATLRVGDPLDKNTDIGAINSADGEQRVVGQRLADGGEVVDRGLAVRRLVAVEGQHQDTHVLGGEVGAAQVGPSLWPAPSSAPRARRRRRIASWRRRRPGTGPARRSRPAGPRRRQVGHRRRV